MLAGSSLFLLGGAAVGVVGASWAGVQVALRRCRRLARLGSAVSPGSFAALAAVGLLVGCGDASEPEPELPTASHDTSDVIVGGGGESVVNEGVVGDASGAEAGDVESPVGGVNEGVVGDAGGAEAGDDSGGGFVDPYVGDVGGVLVKGVCGWPGPLCVGDEGVAPLDEGGRLWWRPRSNWELLVGRVLDLCDDHEAFAAIDGEYWTGYNKGIDYGVKIRSYEMEDIVERRQDYPIVCSEADAATPRWKCVGDASELRAYLGGGGGGGSSSRRSPRRSWLGLRARGWTVLTRRRSGDGMCM